MVNYSLPWEFRNLTAINVVTCPAFPESSPPVVAWHPDADPARQLRRPSLRRHAPLPALPGRVRLAQQRLRADHAPRTYVRQRRHDPRVLRQELRHRPRPQERILLPLRTARSHQHQRGVREEPRQCEGPVDVHRHQDQLRIRLHREAASHVGQARERTAAGTRRAGRRTRTRRGGRARAHPCPPSG